MRDKDDDDDEVGFFALFEEDDEDDGLLSPSRFRFKSSTHLDM
jgi:hypothetical protein